MMRALRFLILVAVFAASTTAWPAGQSGGRGVAPPTSGQKPNQPAVGTGFIAGQVVDIPSGKGIPETSVSLFGRPTAQAPGIRTSQVVTDSQGRFFFANLPPGNYQLSTNKAGYVSPRTSGPPRFELADGERMANAVARLMKLASLSGTLRDEAGDPVVGADVMVLQRYVDSGREVFGGVGGGRSDDRGQYRAGGLDARAIMWCAPAPLAI